ncbi:hypothetical protein GCM10009534_62750 [Kribbella sandramycini]
MPPLAGNPGPDYGPPYGAGPQHWGAPVPQRKYSLLAIFSLVLAILGTTVIALVMGIAALLRIPSRNQRGKGFAIAGIVISSLWIVAIAIAVAIPGGGEPTRDAGGQVTTTQTARPTALRVGDCVAEIIEVTEVNKVEIVPCSGPNGGEVYAVFEQPAGDWPGTAAVVAAAEKGCTDRWIQTKRKLAPTSDILYLHPIESGWRLGDRGFTCLVVPK